MMIPATWVPPVLMSAAAVVELLLEGGWARQTRRGSAALTIALAAESLIAASLWPLAHSGTAEMALLACDSLALFTAMLVWLSAVAFILISYRFLATVEQMRGEYFALALFAQCGMYFMAASTDAVTLFIGLELTAVSFYLLVGYTRADRLSNEAALKYFLLGAVASGVFLYGASLLYGLAGDTRLALLQAAVSGSGARHPFVAIGVLAITAALLFKIAAAPFYSWAPDAYDGAPVPVTGLLATASKTASFAVLLRLLPLVFGAARPIWMPALAISAVASLTLGSIAAVTQTRLKRLFAYSSVAHAGYLLLGFISYTSGGLAGIYFYLLTYVIINIGVFAVLASLRRHGIRGEQIADLRGLSRSHPAHAAMFAILLLSLAGIPPTGGFLAKYLIFAALVRDGQFALAALGAAYVVVGLFFYFRLVRAMYLQDSPAGAPLAVSNGTRLALFGAAAATVLLGLFPEPVLQACARLSQAPLP